MAERSSKRLARIHRVRSLQVDLMRAEEARAAQFVADEVQLRNRIAQLADAVAPVTESGVQFATSLMAAAHYRERLHRSALVAERRVVAAEQGLDRAREATMEARRDQTAIEKLLDRAREQAALRALRELENAPNPTKRNRHGSC